MDSDKQKKLRHVVFFYERQISATTRQEGEGAAVALGGSHSCGKHQQYFMLFHYMVCVIAHLNLECTGCTFSHYRHQENTLKQMITDDVITLS